MAKPVTKVLVNCDAVVSKQLLLVCHAIMTVLVFAGEGGAITRGHLETVTLWLQSTVMSQKGTRYR